MSAGDCSTPAPPELMERRRQYAEATAQALLDTELAEFLTARIADDVGDQWDLAQEDRPRWLAECEAKRLIVQRWKSCADQITARAAVPLPYDAIARDARILQGVMRDLAAVYARHYSFDERWRA